MPDKPVTHGIEHRPNGYDPSITDPWTYVSDGGTAWSSGTTYSAGDSNTSGDVVQEGNFMYLCVSRNKGSQPGSGAHWARYWRIVAPVFQNGWSNTGGSYTHMRYKLVVGPPHVTDESDGSLVDLSDHTIEIQGSVTGGSAASTIFTLPVAYAPDTDLHLSACDDTGAFVCLTVQASGNVVDGFV